MHSIVHTCICMRQHSHTLKKQQRITPASKSLHISLNNKIVQLACKLFLKTLPPDGFTRMTLALMATEELGCVFPHKLKI